MQGPVALVGSGEYLPVMLEVERGLIAGRAPRYVQLPTAAAPEGPASVGRWVELGRKQAERLGVEAVPVLVTDRADADDPALAALVEGAGLVYLSGGNPGYLADTLRDTLVWRAIEAAWRSGAALAGCSAGAMALGGWVPNLRGPGTGGTEGLGALPHLRVIPHFDRFLGRMPDLLTRPFLRHDDGSTLLGIDEQTALVGGPEHFEVQGRQSVWELGEGRRRERVVGERVVYPMLPGQDGTPGR
jgi:cyanophycinase-like exopeptidase